MSEKLALPKDLERVREPAHALQVREVLSALSVSETEGLPEREAERRLNLYGPNKIISQRTVSALAVFLHQLKSPIVYLLGAAAGLALYFGDWKEAVAIAVVLILNAMIGFFTEIKAARSMEALRSLGSHTVRVRREGLTRPIPAEDLVPGDIVILEAGDAVAADLRIVEASNLAADESTLTGESVAVPKAPKAVAPDARLSTKPRCCSAEPSLRAAAASLRSWQPGFTPNSAGLRAWWRKPNPKPLRWSRSWQGCPDNCCGSPSS